MLVCFDLGTCVIAHMNSLVSVQMLPHELHDESPHLGMGSEQKWWDHVVQKSNIYGLWKVSINNHFFGVRKGHVISTCRFIVSATSCTLCAVSWCQMFWLCNVILFLYLKKSQSSPYISLYNNIVYMLYVLCLVFMLDVMLNDTNFCQRNACQRVSFINFRCQPFFL